MDKTESKKEEVIKELGEWFARPNCKNFYYEEPIETVRNNLSEIKLKKSTWLGFDQLENWYKNNFIYKGLVENDVTDQQPMAINGYSIVELTSILAKQFPNNPPSLPLHRMAGYLSTVVIQKWYQEAGKMLELILEGLDTKFLKGGQNFDTSGWFTISVACKAFDSALATEKHNYPKEMGVYQLVIDKWNTQDETEIDRMVSELCDYHLEQADIDERESYEFSFINEFVYAFEVLSWLSLRKMSGLTNPKTLNHPLMRLPINQLPKTTIPFKKTELYDQVLAKVKEEFKG